MSALNGLKPENVFKYFEEICMIPHESGDLDKIAEYCISFAENHKYKWYHDQFNNVIIWKPASKGYEDKDPIILQGHLDMVCEKEADIVFDFRTEGIKPYVDGDFIRAHGTTLGGDNGIGIAMMLAILDDNSLQHPRIEALFTADEETSMDGAFNLDCSVLSGHRLINLDSEYEGIFMCSCAGGVDVIADIPVNRVDFNGTDVIVKVSNLTGGHSGVEIDKGRSNANIIIAKILNQIEKEFRIVSIEGGGRDNAIATNASAIIRCKESEAKVIFAEIARIGEKIKEEHKSADPEMTISFEKIQGVAQMPLSKDGSKKVVDVLLEMPDGVQSMSQDMPGLVQTSSNLGILSLEDNLMKFTSLIRSSVESEKKALVEKMRAIVVSFEGVMTQADDFPGWAFNPDSNLKELVCEAYKEVSGKDGKVDAVHAGIECGLFAERIQDLDCISVGPEMVDVHTPDEHLSISSTERTYRMLKAVLEKAF